MLTIHPPAFIETGSCDGPRYTRGQPSREETGVTMTEIQDKYIPEFELPYRNIQRYIKEIGNDWNRLNEEQRNMARKSFSDMGMIGTVGSPTPASTFANVGACRCTGKKNCHCGRGETFCSGKCKEGFSQTSYPATTPAATTAAATGAAATTCGSQYRSN